MKWRKFYFLNTLNRYKTTIFRITKSCLLALVRFLLVWKEGRAIFLSPTPQSRSSPCYRAPASLYQSKYHESGGAGGARYWGMRRFHPLKGISSRWHIPGSQQLACRQTHCWTRATWTGKGPIWEAHCWACIWGSNGRVREGIFCCKYKEFQKILSDIQRLANWADGVCPIRERPDHKRADSVCRIGVSKNDPLKFVLVTLWTADENQE